MMNTIQYSMKSAMDKTEFHVGDRVMVLADVTGTGENMPGLITHVEVFMHHPVISISFDRPTLIGSRGTCVTNLGLIAKINQHEQK